jgi:hypothetical protein
MGGHCGCAVGLAGLTPSISVRSGRDRGIAAPGVRGAGRATQHRRGARGRRPIRRDAVQGTRDGQGAGSATASRAGRHLSGSATTLIHWADFDVEKPQAAVTQVVSVSDDIRLELDFVGAQAD